MKGVYVADEWLPASPGKEAEENFQELLKKYPLFKPAPTAHPKHGFRGREADESNQSHYLGKRVPENLAIGQGGFLYTY